MRISCAGRLTVLVLSVGAVVGRGQSLPSEPRVVGVMVGTSRGQSAALISCVRTGDPGAARLVAVGDIVCDREVVAIEADAVVLRLPADGAPQRFPLSQGADSASLPPPAAPARADDPFREDPPGLAVTQRDDSVHVVLAPALLEAYLSNLPALLVSATVVPHGSQGTGGTGDGFEVTSVQPGGLVAQLGVRAGDVVLEVNGAPLRDAAGIVSLLADLRAARHATVGIRRGAARVTFVVDIR